MKLNHRLITLLFIAMSSPVHADMFHYKNILIGERASGMGGTFIAISDDPTGIYYNPAGTVFGFENYVSASANSLYTSDTKIMNITAGQNYEYHSTAFTPSFFGFTQNIGKNKVGFAIIVPDSDRYDQNDLLSAITTTAGSANNLLRMRFREDNTYLFGPSYAIGLGDNASIGASLMGFASVGNSIDFQMVTFNPASGATASPYGYQVTYLEYSSYGIIPKIGAQYMPSPQVSLGFTVSKPINLTNSATQRQVMTNATSTGAPVTETGDANKDLTIGTQTAGFAMPAPLNVGLGGAYFFSKAFLLALDLTYSFSDSSGFPVVGTFNASLGTELYLNQGLAVRTGFYSNAANTAAMVTGGTNQLDHVDLYGLSLGISLLKPGSSLTFGAVYSFGSGQTQAVAGTTAVQKEVLTGLGFSIAGSYQM